MVSNVYTILIWISDGTDYERITNFPLTFSHMSTTTSVSVTIVNDNTFELTKSFMASLSFLEGSESTLNLAQYITVAILDDDSRFMIAGYMFT